MLFAQVSTFAAALLLYTLAALTIYHQRFLYQYDCILMLLYDHDLPERTIAKTAVKVEKKRILKKF
jgi:hypothetical protein